jgi:transcriptional regulator with XRE-family HTH domain
MEDTFDFEGFYSAIDAVRRRRRMSWKRVALECEVSASTLSRMAQGSRPDVATVAALTSWATLDLNAFVRFSNPPADRLSQLTSYLQSDPSLEREDARALEDLLHVTYSRLASNSKRRER